MMNLLFKETQCSPETTELRKNLLLEGRNLRQTLAPGGWSHLRQSGRNFIKRLTGPAAWRAGACEFSHHTSLFPNHVTYRSQQGDPHALTCIFWSQVCQLLKVSPAGLYEKL